MSVAKWRRNTLFPYQVQSLLFMDIWLVLNGFFSWGGVVGGGKKLFLNIPLEFSNEIKFVQSEYF